VLVDVEATCDARLLADQVSRLAMEATVGLACSSDTVRRRLVVAGIPPRDCVVIRDTADQTAVDETRRSSIRAQLDLLPEHTVVLALPPAERGTGTVVAAWAAMLLEKVWPGTRLIVPGKGREVQRVSWLVESCRHRWMLRRAGRRFDLSELLAAADLAVFLPTGDAALGGVIAALDSGRPLIASAVPVTRELLSHGENAWLCRPDDPKDAARRMLQALEDPERSGAQAERGRALASQALSPRRLIEQVSRAYANLLAGRRVGEGIVDAAAGQESVDV
jgi:glycosyltransferase involved in cell wall biosynthesis